MCEFARLYKAANGRPLNCDDCPKQHTKHCEKEVENGNRNRTAVGNRVHSAVVKSDCTCSHSNQDET